MVVKQGNDHANNLVGTNGQDTLKGLGGNDILNGLSGADLLDGGTGNDTLYGNLAGTSTSQGDLLIGGAGADRFQFDGLTGNFTVDYGDFDGDGTIDCFIGRIVAGNTIVNGALMPSFNYNGGDRIVVNNSTLPAPPSNRGSDPWTAGTANVRIQSGGGPIYSELRQNLVLTWVAWRNLNVFLESTSITPNRSDLISLGEAIQLGNMIDSYRLRQSLISVNTPISSFPLHQDWMSQNQPLSSTHFTPDSTANLDLLS